MAESPQHPLQIMENQTRFDLNAAMENWRHELAAQPPLAPDNRRELETHLRDALAELKARGLNDEESFWLARRRVGPPQKLAEEFVKNDPAKTWRERVFWAAVIVLAIRFWSEISAIATGFFLGLAVHLLHHHPAFSPFPDWVRFYLPLPSSIDPFALVCSPFTEIALRCLTYLPVAWIAYLLLRGRLERRFSWIQNILSSRRRFLFVTLPVFSIYFALVGSALLSYLLNRNGNFSATMISGELTSLLFPPILIAVIAWLMPTDNPKAQSQN